ncbi:hypothetical protein [Streptomyces sp. NPDC019507]|uniref:hypothetical protein n=1 Tax=Streptomyces sp. NPDC019507 TaxID=3154689 RepID=UPI0033C462E1
MVQENEARVEPRRTSTTVCGIFRPSCSETSAQAAASCPPAALLSSTSTTSDLSVPVVVPKPPAQAPAAVRRPATASSAPLPSWEETETVVAVGAIMQGARYPNGDAHVIVRSRAAAPA